MKNYWILCGFILAAISATGQSVERQVIGAAGQSLVSGIQMDYTVGEVAINTSSTASILLTQGFHQKSDSASSPNAVKTITASGSISVWPNPTTGLLQLEWEGDLTAVEVYNGAGQLILVKQLDNTGNAGLLLNDFAAGVYLVKVSGSNSSDVFRVVKL